jgi:sugar phosphate isomerase/epimerase
MSVNRIVLAPPTGPPGSFRAVPAHPRLSVNSICSYLQPLAADLVLWDQLGIDYVALILPKIAEVGWDEAARMVTDAGLRVSTVFGPTYRPLEPGTPTFAEDQAATVRTVEFAAEVGAESVYICTGAAHGISWDEACDRFTELIARAVAKGAEVGVPILLEPTNPMRADISFIFWQRDAMELARRAGTKVMFDLQSCWYERGIEQLARDNLDLIGITQLSDFKIGTTMTGNRVVPGDGDIPLERLVRAVIDAGFEGSFDLEVMGPVVEDEGYESSVQRCVDRASELLERAGA